MNRSQTKLHLLLLLSSYAVFLFLLLPRLSLWLDEILNVIASTKPTLSRLIEYVPQNSGAVPVGYLVQRLSFHLLGVSEFSARLPSALSSLVAAYGMFALAERMGMRSPLVAVALFCVLPMQWRYAIEGRPYTMALALSIWSTILFLDLLNEPRVHRACLYALVGATGLYTNPYSFFVPTAHVVGLLCDMHESRRQKLTLWFASIGNAVALLLFVPWYLYARRAWIASVSPLGHTSAIKAAELILRELVGAGYIGTALVALLAAKGWKRLYAQSPPNSLFLASCLLVPVPLVFAGNAIFHYFLAARQLIFVLPPLCLLAAFGIQGINADQ